MRSISERTRRPAAVRVDPMRFTMVARLTSGFREMPRYFLIAVLGALSFPWLFYFLAGAGMLVRSRPKTGSGESARYLVLAWFLVVIVFFSLLRSSIASYVLPAYPPMAVVTAMFVTGQFSKRGMSALLRRTSKSIGTILGYYLW